jgi:predicted RNA binding protein YcfA (HicA-like mRNA interferase family)
VSKLRRVSGMETIAALERLGFVQVRKRGSHVLLRKKGARGDIGCFVPLHREVAAATLHNGRVELPPRPKPCSRSSTRQHLPFHLAPRRSTPTIC